MADSREERFARIHSEHFEAVRRYAYRRIPRHAEDVAAETFIVAWRRLEDVPAEPRAWLLAIARNVHLNVLRSERRQRNLAANLEARSPRATQQTQSPAEAPAIAEPVERALEALNEKDREVLLLHAWDELPREEIAAVLGSSKAAVSVRLHRARRRFRAALESALEQSSSGQAISILGGRTDGC